MNEFLGYWFKGFEKGLEEMSQEEQGKLLAQCGKACSESYTKRLYQNIWDKTRNCSDFFQALNQEIEAIKVYEVVKDKEYEIHYLQCLCDLYREGYVKTGCLCECSRQSLTYNLTSIWLDNRIDVQLVSSILQGDKECILKVIIAE